jgi:hypothetical protein
MISAIFFFVIGLFVGWFFLPTPDWAKTVMTKVIGYVPFLGNYMKKD